MQDYNGHGIIPGLLNEVQRGEQPLSEEKKAYLAAGPSVQVTATASTLGSAGIAALANKYITIAGQRRKIVSAAAHSMPANGTILTLDAALTGVANKDATLNSATIYPDGGGIVGNPVAATLVLGKNAYGLKVRQTVKLGYSMIANTSRTR
jgi:hypothetical protein